MSALQPVNFNTHEQLGPKPEKISLPSALWREISKIASLVYLIFTEIKIFFNSLFLEEIVGEERNLEISPLPPPSLPH